MMKSQKAAVTRILVMLPWVRHSLLETVVYDFLSGDITSIIMLARSKVLCGRAYSHTHALKEAHGIKNGL